MLKIKKKKNFKQFQDWHSSDLEKQFGLKIDFESDKLSNWLGADEISLPANILENIEPLRVKLFSKFGEWNEQELLIEFIAPFLATIDFNGKDYSVFSDRELALIHNETKISGYVDWMVASGVYEPESPYFFFHEYKKMRGTEADPLGQLLIAMLAAQNNNQNNNIVYGCYVIGAIWRFVLLENKNYQISELFDATSPKELLQIWKTLFKTKQIIEKQVQEELLAQKPLL